MNLIIDNLGDNSKNENLKSLPVLNVCPYQG